MKAYKIEMIVVDFEGYGRDSMVYELENMKFYSPDVIQVEEADIGEWFDDHPLNLSTTKNYDKRSYFGE